MTNIKQELEKINQSMAAAPAGTHLNHISLFPGITLCFITFQTDHLQVQHEPLEHILEINYCHAGRMGWRMGSGHHVYLGPGDFSIHMMETCALSAFCWKMIRLNYSETLRFLQRPFRRNTAKTSASHRWLVHRKARRFLKGSMHSRRLCRNRSGS